MKARLFLVITIAATMLWSCQFDDVLSTPSDGGVIRVTSSLTKAESTGETNESTTNDNFKSNEIIYVWADKTGDSDGYIKAWKLTANDDNGHFTGDSKAWPYDGSSLDFHALHGNFTEGELNNNWSSLTSLKHTVLDDQSSDENRRKSDLLYAEKTEATHGNNVELSFEHLLAKITVKLDLKNSKGITKEDFENASVSILGIQPEATFNRSSQTAPTSGGGAIDIKAGTIPQPDNMDSEAYYAGSAIVPLQTIAANSSLIQISLKDRIFIYKASATTTFQKGQEYTYTLTIRGRQITGTLSVSPFDTADEESISFNDYFDYLADLKNRNYLGSSSAPHDLSYDYNGMMNTANCYVVTHPGYYKIPLVYGNAIKNGATNAIAYGIKDGSRISSTFVNHLGNQITDPYIYNNKDNSNVNLSAGSAELVWQDAQNLISTIDLCDESKYIKFEITKENIEQGNAVIAVKDEAGTIMWSWHIWVTNKNVYETVPIQTVALTNLTTQKTYNFMPVTLGLDDDEPEQPNCTYYQWGRKDPFCPSTATKNNKILYDISGATISFSTESSIVTTEESIKKPQTFYTAPSNSYDWNSTTYFDYWNAENVNNTNMNDNKVEKTVYDPNPAGFKMPSPDAFTGFTANGSNQNDKNDKTKWNVERTTIDKGYSFYTQGWQIGPINFWWATGFRAYDTGFSGNIGNGCDYWTAGPHTNSRGRSFHFCVDHISPQSANYRAYGFCVRPVSE